MLRVEDLIESEDYHHNPHKPIMHLHRFMTAHQVDFVGTTFKEGLQLSETEAKSNVLVLHLWFIMILEGTKDQVRRCLEFYRKRLTKRQYKSEKQ